MHSLIYTHILSHLLLFAMHSLIYTHILSPLDQVLIEKPQNDTESIMQARERGLAEVLCDQIVHCFRFVQLWNTRK